MSAQLDPLSARLIDQLQAEIPLVERPFAEIGRILSMSEADVIDRVKAMRAKQGGVIRQISAIFDSRLLGYESCLIAAKVDPSRLDEAAAEISKHPGVSHNYRREHAYNLWYTIAVPPDSQFGLERSVEILHQRCGAIASRLMPAIKMYKIGVKFDLSEGADALAVKDLHQPAAAEEVSEYRGNGVSEFLTTPLPRYSVTPIPPPLQSASPFAVTETAKRLVRVLQQDLPAEPRPFDGWAAEAGLSVPALLEAAAGYRATGVMRRFSAVLRHREAGFSANAMGVWPVPDDDCDRFGEIAAGFRAVSHCYRRPTYPDWPYSCFTMVHAPTLDAANAVLASISEATGYKDYGALLSTKEYKKVRVNYFTGDIEAWEQTASP